MQQEQLKVAGDAVALPVAFLSWVKAISIPELAAFAAFVYTALRIGELVYGWIKAWRNRE